MGTSTCTNPAPIDTKYFYRPDVNDDCLISLDDLVALLGNFGLSAAHSMHAVYLWDAENRLSEVIPSAPSPSAKRVNFRYDYMSRRVEKLVYARNAGDSAWQIVPSDHRRWVYFGWLPILELKVTHATSGEETGTVIARKYTWGLDLSQSVGGAGGIGGLLASVDCGENTTASDDRTFAYFYDGNGNVTQLIETTGGTAGANFGTLAARYEYDPYGRPLLDDADTGVSGTYAATNTFRFSTKPVDAETSFSYFGYRYYSATMGRWISHDPIGEFDSLNLNSANRNAPVIWIDPDGRSVGSNGSVGPPAHIISWFEGGPGYGGVANSVTNPAPASTFDSTDASSLSDSKQFRGFLFAKADIKCCGPTITEGKAFVSYAGGFTNLSAYHGPLIVQNGGSFVQGTTRKEVRLTRTIGTPECLRLKVRVGFRVAMLENVGQMAFNWEGLTWAGARDGLFGYAWSEITYTACCPSEVHIDFQGSGVPSHSAYVNEKRVAAYSMNTGSAQSNKANMINFSSAGLGEWAPNNVWIGSWDGNGRLTNGLPQPTGFGGWHYPTGWWLSVKGGN